MIFFRPLRKWPSTKEMHPFSGEHRVYSLISEWKLVLVGQVTESDLHYVHTWRACQRHIMRYCNTNSIPLEFLQRARLHQKLTAISSGSHSWPHSVGTVSRRPLDRTECSRQPKQYFVQLHGSTIADAPPLHPHNPLQRQSKSVFCANDSPTFMY